MPLDKVFLDAAYAIALANPADEHHDKANTLADRLLQERSQIVTTRAVLVEIGNFLAKLKHRAAAVEMLNAIEHDPTIQIAPLSEELYQAAFALYQDRPDKEWGLTDCISFVLMKERNIQDAMTTDEHFEQAGFHALLRE